MAGACVSCVKSLAFLAVFVYATHATKAILFEWKPGFSPITSVFELICEMQRRSHIEYAQLQVHDVDGVGDDDDDDDGNW